MIIKAITLHQPWASFFVAGVKTIETRHWQPSENQLKIGDYLAIHAGKTTDYTSLKHLITNVFGLKKRLIDVYGDDYLNEMPEGKVLCVCRFGGVSVAHKLVTNPMEWALGNYGHDRFAWHLPIHVILTPPIPARGQQAIWEVEIPDSALALPIESKPNENP